MRNLFSILCLSFLLGQTVNLPYDLSGQYGISSINGRLFWNSDWTSGPLLFDGAYTHYPERYGNAIANNFQMTGIHIIPQASKSLADTAHTVTNLNYVTGDYNFDLLSIDADFNSPGRYVGLHGFKRSYSGREGQFFHPHGSASPMQQSYVVNYRSENKGWFVDAAAARLVMESGLPDSGAVNGLHEDEIMNAGLIIRSPSEILQWTSHLALFQQWRRVDVSWYSNTVNQYLNRMRWHNQLGGLTIGNLNPLLGLDMNTQSITKNDSTFRNINWQTLYGQVNLWGVKTAVGLMLIDSNVADYIAVDYSKSWGRVEIQTDFEKFSKPHHFNLISIGDGIAHHTRSKAEIKSDFKSSIIALTADYSSMIYDERKYLTLQTGIMAQTKLYDHFSLSGSYFSRDGGSLIFDGIGTIAGFDLQYYNENVFNRFALKMNLSGEGLLNRKIVMYFNSIDSFPYEFIKTSLNQSDIWLLNAEVAITISSMTITWSIKNILQAIEPTSLKLFPKKETGDFLIQHHHQFPPMGRLVMFGIYWTFKD